MDNKKEKEKLYNIIGAYSYLKLATNHLQCIQSTTDDNYLENKIAKLIKEAGKLMKPIELNLKKMGTFDQVEDTIIKIHEITDPILS